MILAALIAGWMQAAPPPDACVLSFRRLVNEPSVKAELIQGNARAGPETAFEKTFAERCRKHPEADQSCLINIETPFTRCAVVQELGISNLLTMPIEKRRKIELEIARDEVRLTLHAIGRSLAMNAGSGEFEFPPSTPWTPARDCCASETWECITPLEDWSDPTWQALSFTREKVRYQYRVITEGVGASAHFTVEAQGDPTCSKKKSSKELWRIEGRMKDGRMELLTWDPVQVK